MSHPVTANESQLDRFGMTSRDATNRPEPAALTSAASTFTIPTTGDLSSSSNATNGDDAEPLEGKSMPCRLMGMTGVAHTYQFAGRGLLTTLASHRLVLVAGAIILLVAGYVLATQLGTTASPPLHLDPMSTAPGAGV